MICASGHVTRINLSFNRLSGSIPAALGNLAGLERLDLSSNQLSGTIPAALGNLAGLESLDLGSNQLSGRSRRNWTTWPSWCAYH